VIESFPLAIEVSVQDHYFLEGDRAVEEETWRVWVETWLTRLADYLPAAPSYELSLRLTNDREIQTYNANYRQKDRPTDVLAFAALEVEVPVDIDNLGKDPLYLGDLIISVETALCQAQQHGHSLARELAWLAAHGCLHLLGWDHPDETSLREMLSLQETLLNSVEIGDT
jgi:probable rRNA maturation factor